MSRLPDATSSAPTAGCASELVADFGAVARIAMRDVAMRGVATPVAINAFYFCDPDGRSAWVQSCDAAQAGKSTPRIERSPLFPTPPSLARAKTDHSQTAAGRADSRRGRALFAAVLCDAGPLARLVKTVGSGRRSDGSHRLHARLGREPVWADPLPQPAAGRGSSPGRRAEEAAHHHHGRAGAAHPSPPPRRRHLARPRRASCKPISIRPQVSMRRLAFRREAGRSQTPDGPRSNTERFE